MAFILWVFAEIAIIATDIAEVVGTAIGLNLLFGIPLEIGVIITALDVFLILCLQRLGFRWVEAFIIGLLGVIFVCFFVQIAMADPDWGGVIQGFAPTTEIVTNPKMLYLALGIIGATVMPHNLYLHSGMVQTRALWPAAGKARGPDIRHDGFDRGPDVRASRQCLDPDPGGGDLPQDGATDVAELGDAHAMLAPLLGSLLAPKLFAIALLCCGLNSTVTATLAGQIVMEGFLSIRLPAWLRRLFTRMFAIIPAAAVTIYYGAEGTGALLILSQVILAFQLPFAIVPLVMFTRDRAKMGALVRPPGSPSLRA